MKFEIIYALKSIGGEDNRPQAYHIQEALDDYDITIKREAVMILADLSASGATAQLIEKVRLY